MGDETWKVFELLRKSRKLVKSLERDGFPSSGKEQLESIDRRVRDLRKRFKELEQLLRTRDLDIRLADHEIAKLERSLTETDRSQDEVASLRRALAHAEAHREHIVMVMQARNTYVTRLQELYYHVRQLHSHMMMVDTPAVVESDELIEEIDALVDAVDAVELVRKEVQSSLERRRAAHASAKKQPS